MINIDDRLKISLVQGDTGGIEFSLSCVELDKSDRASFIVTDELNNKVFKMYGIIENGLVYFRFLKEHTSFEPKTYKYHIKCTNSENGIDATFINNKEFIIYRGYDYA